MGMVDELKKELDMMQLSDSFFPTGLFATSSGLENMFLNKKVTTVGELAEFNRTCLEQQVGPGDCVVLTNTIELCASESYGKIREADALCSAMKPIREIREASSRSGIQLARCVKEFQGEDKVLNWYWQEIQNNRVIGVYPVSFAVCCNALGITKERASLMMLYGFVASTAGAALRLGMIEHFESQKMIHELKPLILKITRESSVKSLEDIWQFSPQIEINQMSHEERDSKMFIT